MNWCSICRNEHHFEASCIRSERVLEFFYKGSVNVYQRIVGFLRGYGTQDARYRPWFLWILEKRAAKQNWVGVWSNGMPRPWIGGWDKRMPSDAEFREIIKQNIGEAK